jgi:hypothetical protein
MQWVISYNSTRRALNLAVKQTITNRELDISAQALAWRYNTSHQYSSCIDRTDVVGSFWVKLSYSLNALDLYTLFGGVTAYVPSDGAICR